VAVGNDPIQGKTEGGR